MTWYIRMIAIVTPMVIAARFVLFDDATEFARFSAALKTYVLPGAFVFFLVLAGGLIVGKMVAVSGERQQFLFRIFSWTSWAVLVVSVSATFVYVKSSG